MILGLYRDCIGVIWGLYWGSGNLNKLYLRSQGGRRQVQGHALAEDKGGRKKAAHSAAPLE